MGNQVKSEHPLVGHVRNLLAGLEAMSIEEIEKVRVRVSAHRIEKGGELANYMKWIGGGWNGWRTSHVHGRGMCLRSLDNESRNYEATFYYEFGLLAGEDCLKEAIAETVVGDPNRSVEGVAIRY